MYKIRLDDVGFSKKPSKSEIARINKRLSLNEAAEIEWTDFCRLAGNKGHTFCAADFDGTRSNENFKSQQLFALDFDNTVDYETVQMRAKQYHFPIALAYETFSSNKMSHFRIVFILDTLITDIVTAKTITAMLMELFPEADNKCCDPARMFFGGKGIIECNETAVLFETINMEFGKLYKDRYGEKHYKERLRNFADKNKANTKNGFIQISQECTEIKKVRAFSFTKLSNSCRLYREFESGDIWLYHNQLMGIMMNMINIEGGNRRFLGIANNINNANYGYSDKDLKYYIHYMTKMGYKPQMCDNFCPYADECNHAANMINTAKTVKNTVVKLREKKYYTVEEAYDDMREKLEAAINSPVKRINIIKAQTAIGKTHCYVNMIKKSKKKFIIAVPTNILKDEVYERLKNEGVQGVVKTYSIQEVESMQTDIGKKVKELNSLGAHREVIEYLKRIAETEDKPHYLNYIKPLHEYYSDDTNVIVTTHKKLMGADERFLGMFEIIVDEDILMTASKNSVDVYVSDLLKLGNEYKVNEVMKSDSNFVRTQPLNYEVSLNEMEQKGIYSNVNAFFAASAIYKSGDKVNCFVPPRIPNVKFTVMSATAKKEIYEMFCKDRIVHFDECIEAKYKGKLIQDWSRSYSRRDIDSDPEFFNKLKKENKGFDYIITFMKYKSKADDCIIHFGNTEGCDYMKGKNIIVAGTPHYNEVVYKLIACHIGVDCDCKMRFREVTDSCYKYWLNTYENPQLRDIQLWILKSELIQAIGRARLLRYGCTVKLYAGIPLDQAVEHEFFS